MKRRIGFDDGSYLEWESKEGLWFVKDGFVALVWVDFGPGSLFSKKRILMKSSIQRWKQTPVGASAEIPVDIQTEIIEKVAQYFPRKQIIVENDIAQSR